MQSGFISDLEVFMREAAARFDEQLDVSAGSPFDTRVIQPTLQRVGTDPFSVDVKTFLLDRLNQEFPELAVREGDALTDLLIKPLVLLLEPIVRENARIKQSLSFRSPELLTTEEAADLGGNLFSEIATGDLARGTARVYFTTPQNASIGPSNYCRDKLGQRFFPDSTQSIRADEMILNAEGTRYYFDFTVVAEEAGESYNIEPGTLVSIQGVPSAVQVTNKRRFRFGAPAETAIEFTDRAKQELSERSLVTERGISAVLPKAFPDITRLAVVGFRDPEMQRDVLTGGGLGPIIAAGVAATPISDGEGRLRSRRVSVPSTESAPGFTTTIGPAGTVKGWTLTLFKGLPSGSVPSVRDYAIRAVVNDTTLDLAEQLLDVTTASAFTTGTWLLRRNVLELSGIPGGIVFPEGTTGKTTVVPGEVHIGGCTDVYLRGTELDSATLAVTNLTDAKPVLSGILGHTLISPPGQVGLDDLILGTNYEVGDDTYLELERAARLGYGLRLLTGFPGTYSILSVLQTAGNPPQLIVRGLSAITLTGLRWQLLDRIDVDLVEPKVSKLTGSDAQTVMGLTTIETFYATSLSTYGVAAGDTLRILNGPDAGDFTISSVTGPFSTQLVVDRAPTRTTSSLSYEIFTPNSDGGVQRPLIRVTGVDLLDGTGQPVGTKVPYGAPVGTLSEAFANTGVGVKASISDGRIGVVGDAPLAATTVGLDTLQLMLRHSNTSSTPYSGGTIATVTFAGASLTREQIVSQINTAVGFPIAILTKDLRLGLIAYNGTTSVANIDNSSTVLTKLFGSSSFEASSRTIRSSTILDWTATSISPPIEPLLDVVDIVSGNQVGALASPEASSTHLLVGVGEDVDPEANVYLRVGSRSIGTARMYFLEPTSIELNADTRFYAELEDGSRLTYLPDPSNSSQRVPALPSGTKPKDGQALSFSQWRAGGATSGSVDFIAQGILPGDQLVIDYVPLIGTAVLADPVPALDGLTLVVSVEGKPEQTITFSHDSSAIAATSVTRQGVADQINNRVGKKVAKISSAGKLELEADFALTLKTTGTANTALGFAIVDERSNASQNAGTYTVVSLDSLNPRIATISPTTLVTVFSGALATYSDVTRQQFKVLRSQTQRISVTEMSSQVGAAGLYYFDVQLVSDGTGDSFNIPRQTVLSAEGYRADGYVLATDDSNLSFSTGESVRAVFSRSILPVGVNDDPQNAIQLSGQNVQIAYDRSSLISSVQAFLDSESERVTNNSPLARHLVPHFVRFSMAYTGTVKEADLLVELTAMIEALLPSDFLESSDIQAAASQAGATSISNPLDLFAIVYPVDRTVTMQFSQDRLNTGRLAAFLVDQLLLTRGTT